MAEFVKALAARYFRHGVGTYAAAAAFYLLFALFPLLIFLSAVLGLLRIDPAALPQILAAVAPPQAADLAEVYLRHVQSHPSGALAAFALVFSLWFPTRAALTLLRGVRRAYGLEMPKRTLRRAANALCCTLILLAALAGMLTVLSVTERAAEALGVPSVSVPLRLAAVGCGGGFALSLLYRLAQEGKPKRRDLWPGTAFALGAWLVISWGYSIYVEHFADYPALYGSLGTVVAVLVWLELTAATLIMGAEVNGMVIERP